MYLAKDCVDRIHGCLQSVVHALLHAPLVNNFVITDLQKCKKKIWLNETFAL